MVCVGTDDHTDFVVSSDFGKIISISQGPIPVPVEGSKILPSMLPDKTFPEVVFREDTMYQQFNKDSKVVSNVTLGHEEVTDNTFPSRVEPLKQTSRIQVVHSTGRKEVVNLIESKDNVNFADTSSKMDSAGRLSKQCPQVSKHPSSSKYYGYNEQCANGLLPLKYCEESKSQHLYICTFVASSESLPPKNSVAASESLPPVDTLPSGSFSPTEYEPIRPHYISVQPQALHKQEAFMTPAANGGTREDGQEVTQDSQTSCGRSAGDGTSCSEVPVAVSVFLYGQEVKEENVSCEVNIKQEVDVVEEALDSPCSIYH
ncbi:hypothetical protein Hamer_G017071 [Homarus americanus]|uniref:Uncharacterized protein n=2 Tax=Homarus americanus TaxID=6706 RepID=A0A8J5KA88_HOMAM|nr:hypothetical protein Hamer_G017071 [Homarus americanus]